MELRPDPEALLELRRRAARHRRLAIANEQMGDWAAAQEARAEAEACEVLSMLYAESSDVDPLAPAEDDGPAGGATAP